MTDTSRSSTAATGSTGATSSTPLLTYASTTTTTNPHPSPSCCRLFSSQNPIPLWYRLFLPLIEPLTSVIAMYQLVFHPVVYLSETTPGAIQGYNPHVDTLFNQLAVCMMFTIYVESWLFGYKWADQPDQWNSAVWLLLLGDVWFNIALFQGNQWLPWWKWGEFPGANGRLLWGTAIMGLLGPGTRVAFLARVGFKPTQQQEQERRTE